MSEAARSKPPVEVNKQMAPTTTRFGLPGRTLLPAGSLAHRVARLAAGIRLATRDAGVVVPQSYAERVASDGSAHCHQLGVTRLGDGVVIHTAPESHDELPVVLGYVSPDGQWLRNGTSHRSPQAAC
jgi:hypothetical protein